MELIWEVSIYKVFSKVIVIIKKCLRSVIAGQKVYGFFGTIIILPLN